jgi:putative flippase GtrA
MSENPVDLSMVRSFLVMGWKRPEARFIVIGALNTLFGYVTFSLFIFLGLHYILASTLGTILGVIFNFHTIGKYVFMLRETTLLTRFVMAYVLTYSLSIVTLTLGTYFISNMYLNGACSTLIVAFLSFQLHKHYVFVGKAHEAN